MSRPLEHDYIGLTEHSLSERSAVDDEKASVVNLRETELRLGLPGSESPERNLKHELSFFEEFVESKNKNSNVGNLSYFVSGGKRGFSDTIYGCSNWGLCMMDSSSGFDLGKGDSLFSNKERNGGLSNGKLEIVENKKNTSANDHASAPASKAQVVGWPPIRSFRKNTLAANLSKNNDVEGGTAKSGCLFVKVSMDGAPYLRKVDLNHYSNYTELSSSLEKMFSCFTIGQCISPNIPGQGGLSESRLMDLLHGSEFVLTYEDKDSDWMLVGDVPWEMFLDSCKRLRIVRSTDAIGLAPRALQGKNQN